MKENLKRQQKAFPITTTYLKVVKHPLHKTNLNDENLKNRKENKYTRKHKL